MPRKRVARVVTRYGVVSQGAVDAEAKYIARDVEDYLIQSLAELRKRTDERHDFATKSWQLIQQAIHAFPDRDAEAVRALLFRDLFHVLECYRSFCSAHAPEAAAPIIPDRVAAERDERFSEWLFPR